MNIEELSISEVQIKKISEDFCGEMERAVRGSATSLKMLPSFLNKATTLETGKFLALDFGGTNLRISLLELQGNGRYEELAHRKISVGHLGGVEFDAVQLFDFIAELINSLQLTGERYLLGHTFSYPSRQWGLNHAELICWTKEFATRGVVGENINLLLQEALQRRGMSNVVPVAILNDTVATLLAASYRYNDAIIGSICGTGHNSAFYDASQGMIFNMESGNFSLLPYNVYDKILDGTSLNPGQQRLEKMAAGLYLGEMFRLICKPVGFTSAYSFSANMLANVLNDTDGQWEQSVAKALVVRAARLVTATYIGAMCYAGGFSKEGYTVAIDGSLYAKMPFYADTIRETFSEQLGVNASRVRVVAEQGGSILGAALAACSANVVL